jgi:hypothetical protein
MCPHFVIYHYVVKVDPIGDVQSILGPRDHLGNFSAISNVQVQGLPQVVN